MSVTIGLAFLAGLASFLSPCVFPLVPVYVGYLAGRSAVMANSQTKNVRYLTFFHGIAFVVGFSLVFIAMGAAISVVGVVLYDFKDWLSKIGGIIVIVFGLHLMGIIQVPFLNYDLRPTTTAQTSQSYLSSFFLGVFFSAGWSPCVGPVLGTILMIALNGGNLSKGIELLIAYSAGLAVPFLIAAAGLSQLSGFFKKVKSAIRTIELITGALLITMGILLYTGSLEKLSSLGTLINFGL